ncbi:hypothetical protein LWM68_38520 [Niabella sp. W65]|nr:hypothetical protein [Niabella sp. W65]MCH7368114.1 hypothetical protein [Niabella sp. W65]
MAFYLKHSEKQSLKPAESETVTAASDNTGDNLDFLISIVGNDKAVLAEILNEMRLQWQKDKTDLAAARDLKDTGAVDRLLHRMKSTFSSLGPDHSVYKVIISKGRLIHNGERIVAENCNDFIEEIDSLINKTLKEDAKN